MKYFRTSPPAITPEPGGSSWPSTESAPSGDVRAWEQSVSIPTYAPDEPERHPMFLENRVYQGSNGRVYPSPIIERIADQKSERSYRALFLENEYVQLMLLPEIGGRIHVGLDKTNQYDFFYRQRVIKPALVGLLGPWISGGVEFNWPQHHRPSTFMPVHYSIEAQSDGSCTVWMGEHDLMERTKGMLGITLSPGKSLIEAKVRLFNRTRRVQTFLWWANAGVHVHDDYEAFFPPDVTHVADHARRAVSEYPIARGTYYGVDYRPGTDISWWRNIPVPTSYMVTSSRFDFMGGYDHRRQAGLVQIADHHIAPGKKLWTWGNSEFGRAWEQNLTDADGPYIELMMGAYTDNQPDFSWLQPYETRVFSHYWYPIQRIGLVKNANTRLAVNLEVKPEKVFTGVCASERLAARIELRAIANGEGKPAMPIWSAEFELAPGQPFVRESAPKAGLEPQNYLLLVFDRDGQELIRYQPWPQDAYAVAEARCDGAQAVAMAATEPPPPAQVAVNDELILIGTHLEQYRHATRSPEPYWQEALRRDPGDARAHLALGRLQLSQGLFQAAVAHFQAAIVRLTARNSNPESGEVFYQLGMALAFLNRPEEAYIAFYKSVWDHAWRAAGFYSLAELDSACGNSAAALAHLEQSLAADPAQLKARNLKAALHRRLGHLDLARELVAGTLAADPLDLWARNEASLLHGAGDDSDQNPELAALSADVQLCLDVAFDYAAAGFWQEARALLEAHSQAERPYPMALYASGYFACRQGNPLQGQDWYRRAAQAPTDYCFPVRLEEMLVLEATLEAAPYDARAHYYLGNLYYDKQRREDAARHWKQSTALDEKFSLAWRNLALASYRLRADCGYVRDCCRRAFEAAPGDARLLEEFDQLERRLATAPAERLARLEQYPHLVEQRDTLVLEKAALLLRLDRPQAALDLLIRRRFHPWEGGEGLASQVYTVAHLRLSQAALNSNQPAAALEHCEQARRLPQNLGEFRHPLTPVNQLDYQTAMAYKALGNDDLARQYLERAAAPVLPPSAATYWRALALRAIGRESEASECLHCLHNHAQTLRTAPPQPDYFATSIPDFSVFPQDLATANTLEAELLTGLANLGLGQPVKGRAALERALKLDPAHLGASEAMWQNA